MALHTLTPEQVSQIKADLSSLGVEGSALFALPALKQSADSHAYIREVVLAFLRSLFRSMPVGSYRWDPETSVSEVVINYADTRAADEQSKTPAITVELAPFTWGQNSINDFLGGKADGTKYYTSLRNGAVVIRCRAGVKLEADSLASILMGGLKYMHEEIEKAAGFTYIDAYTANPSSGELVQTATKGEFFVANVVANVHYQESWHKPPNQRITGPVIMNKEPKGVILT